MAEWGGQDWVIFFTALSTFLATFGATFLGIFRELHKIKSGVEDTKVLANGNLSAAQKRIEQLTEVISANGLVVPATRKPVIREEDK